MNEPQEQNQDVIPESRAARWAWRVSLIPVLGIPLFMALAFLALYRIGSKGRTGFWLLRRGVIAIFIVSAVSYFGFYLSGYSGYYHKIYDTAYSFFPQHGVYRTFYDDGPLEVQSSWWFGTRDGATTTWFSNGKKMGEGKFVNGKAQGKWTLWSSFGTKKEGEYLNDREEGTWTEVHYSNYKDSDTTISQTGTGGYRNGKKEGSWIWKNSQGTITYEYVYKNDRMTKAIEYQDGKPHKIRGYKNDNLVKTTILDRDGNPIEVEK